MLRYCCYDGSMIATVSMTILGNLSGSNICPGLVSTMGPSSCLTLLRRLPAIVISLCCAQHKKGRGRSILPLIYVEIFFSGLPLHCQRSFIHIAIKMLLQDGEPDHLLLQVLLLLSLFYLF